MSCPRNVLTRKTMVAHASEKSRQQFRGTWKIVALTREQVKRRKPHHRCEQRDGCDEQQRARPMHAAVRIGFGERTQNVLPLSVRDERKCNDAQRDHREARGHDETEVKTNRLPALTEARH